MKNRPILMFVICSLIIIAIGIVVSGQNVLSDGFEMTVDTLEVTTDTIIDLNEKIEDMEAQIEALEADIYRLSKDIGTSDYRGESDTMFIQFDEIGNRIIVFGGLESDVEVFCRDFYVNGEKVQ